MDHVFRSLFIKRFITRPSKRTRPGRVHRFRKLSQRPRGQKTDFFSAYNTEDNITDSSRTRASAAGTTQR